jgi:hypothetical protein
MTITNEDIERLIREQAKKSIEVRIAELEHSHLKTLQLIDGAVDYLDERLKEVETLPIINLLKEGARNDDDDDDKEEGE